MAYDPALKAHQEWLGFVQPVGLVVSPPAMQKAQAQVDRQTGVRKQPDLIRLAGLERASSEGATCLRDLPAFFQEFLDWQASDLVSDQATLDSLSIYLEEFAETLVPSYAVADVENSGKWQMLVRVEPEGQDLDAQSASENRGWPASPQARFERLLRENDVAIGLLINGACIRLVYAPRGESSGHLTFPVKAMCEVGGRPLVAALHILLCAPRLFTLPTNLRLPAILKDSRKYQNEVSNALADQVQTALGELLKGFQAADEATGGSLLATVLREAPQDIYGGLLTTLMRLVFILYAEERGLLSLDAVYQQFYSVSGLFEKLREDDDRYPDTMDNRYGAWPQLLTVFRLLHDGASHGMAINIPPRAGNLFNPDAYPFLEGRPHGALRVKGDKVDPPRVPDGIVFRVLQNLLVLRGDRLSYRALDVEQIGSVYEAMMGFALAIAKGPSIAVRPHHVVVNLAAIRDAASGSRAKLLKDSAGCDLKGQALEMLKAAGSVEDLVAAIGKNVSPHAPRVIPPGSLYLQPTEERRRSGSHYTPRSLTEPIVRTTFRPIFDQLGDSPKPEQILALKVCDPAMGSGAFLVEACRFLADKLVKAWDAQGTELTIPPDEDKVLHARRQVAQRCLYGVDKNPFAVDLAKLSLWLVTLAKDHPFTFLDHSLRCGDSLVGLSREQIASFNWAPKREITTIHGVLAVKLAKAEAIRIRIQGLADSDDTGEKALLLLEAENLALRIRMVGDLAILAFFGGKKDKEREELRRLLEPRALSLLDENFSLDSDLLDTIEGLRSGDRPLKPFHWEIEFPEVFLRENPGFDAFVGNPPFAGKNTLKNGNREGYLPFLQALHSESHGNSDLVAHFFRRAFDLLSEGGTLGLIATNTIAQGDTRSTGLRWLCTHGGTIYEAKRRIRWPGKAAVVVSVVHVAKSDVPPPYRLDGSAVELITAFLFDRGNHENPATLKANKGKGFQGSIVLGMGFTFDDDNQDATSIVEMQRLIAKDPRNAERIFPYLGGKEINESPDHVHRRHIINISDLKEEDLQKWNDLVSIIESKSRGKRAAHSTSKWWQFERLRADMYVALRRKERIIAFSRVTEHFSPAFIKSGPVFADSVVVVASDSPSLLAFLQSRVHESWARFASSSLGEGLRYSVEDCLETFPFLWSRVGDANLEAIGQGYSQFRADLMLRNNEGLTKTYNRFHDPDERDPGILELRRLHAEMDRAVLDAYGWTDLQPTCDFYLAYEEDEDADDSLRKRKKPWRYRWPDEFRDEVLARLLELNRQRAETERLIGESGCIKRGGGGKGGKPGSRKPDSWPRSRP